MSKKKLTKKRKKQLLAMFMTAGMMTNTFISTGVAFADATSASDMRSEVNTQNTSIPFEKLGADAYGDTITSISVINDQLKVTKTVNNEDQKNNGYLLIATDDPEYKLDKNEWVDSLVQDIGSDPSNLHGTLKVSSYKDKKYYYIVTIDTNVAIARINGADLGKNVGQDQSTITANNATVEYGSAWNDDVAKQVTGVKATDKDGNDVTANVTVSGTVDTNTPGNYNVTFTSPESGKTYTVVITVKSPTAPSIKTPNGAGFVYGRSLDLNGGTPGAQVEIVFSQVRLTNKEAENQLNNQEGMIVTLNNKGGALVTHDELCKGIAGYKDAKDGFLYFRAFSGETKGLVSGVQVLSPTPSQGEASISANDFTLEYGAEFNDEIAIEKAGATATDANGNPEGVKVKESNVDTSKPGEYSVTFVSDSGKEKTVKVTVKESVKAETPIFETPYIYGTTLKGKTSPNATVDLRVEDLDGTDFTIKADTNGDFSISAEKLKQNEKYKIGTTIFALASFGTTESRSNWGSVQVEGNATINAHDFEVDYGFDLTDEAAIEKAGATATDTDGNVEDVKVKESNVDTSKPGEYSITFVSASGKEKTVKVTVKSPEYEKPVIENPYTYQTDLKGKTTPNSNVYISDSEGFNGFITIKADSSGNFTVTSDQLNVLSHYTPGNTLYVKSGDVDTNNFSEIANILIHYPTPKVAQSYAYNTEITGTAYPNSQIYVSDKENFERYVTVVADKSGHFTVPLDKLKALSTYGNGSTLYFESADDFYSQAKSLKVSTKITENKASITANDFTLEYGAEFNDQIAIEKAGATATNADGNVEGVKVKESNVDTSKPGEYSVTFVSDSGKEKTVKVTVKESVKAETPVFETPYIYGDTLKGKTSPNASVDIRVGAPSEVDFTIQADDKGDFSISAEKLKQYTDYKIGNWINATASFGTTASTSSLAMVKIEENHASIEANDFEVDYGFDLTDEAAIEKAGAKATDKYGKSEGVKVKESNVDTSKPGEYSVTFVSDSGKEKTVKVTVKAKPIVGSEPIIHASDMTYQVGETLNPLLGVTAEDPEDGDLTDQVKADATGVNMSKPGDYELILSVTDKDGNTTEQTVTVHVVDQVTDGPVIKGAEDIRIDERSKFDPLEGVTAQDGQGNDITDKLTYTGSVDTSTPGEYTIKYYVYDNDGKVATAKRVVTVQSDASKPVVMSPDKLTVKQNSKFDPTLYAQAYDNEDGDITDQIKILGQIYTDKLGSQFITYEVTDSDGNKASKIMEVEVVATLGNAPVISGADDLEINVGDKFDPVSGVTAYDNEDGDLTSEIKYGGVVDTGKAGEYTITYTVWDSDFNTETVERTITVKDPTVEPAIEANDFEVDYGFDLTDEAAIEKAGAKATDKYGKEEGVKVKESNVDTSKPGEYSMTFISDSGKEKTVKVTVKDASEENATIEANDFEVDYGFDLTDEAAIEKAGAKATDKYGKEEGVKVKESNVDTSKPGEYSMTFIS
ncbi:immunoglobulin-like domain-containing protein, partial [Enterococcus hirae]|uniref:immunoglobulin-like domain-containing protein n=1 Tax=Enterococcus hirae TaxID=1354 RepID=UPI0039A5CC32